MPTGFKGAPATLYLGKANGALSEARSVHDRTNLKADAANKAVATAIVTAPRSMSAATATQIAGVKTNFSHSGSRTSSPHEETTAFTGSHKTGVGTSRNVVVSSGEYSAIFSRLNQIDDDMGRTLFKISTDIEDLCRGDFVLPRTVQKCNVVSGGLKNALGEYRSLTEDTLVRTRRFVNSIMSIG